MVGKWSQSLMKGQRMFFGRLGLESSALTFIVLAIVPVG